MSPVMLRLCAPATYGRHMIVVSPESHEIMYYIVSFQRMDEIRVASNMGEPCWWAIKGHWQTRCELFDWTTDAQIGEPIEFMGASRIISAAVVGSTNIAIVRSTYIHMYTPAGYVYLDNARNAENDIVVERTGRRLYIGGNDQNDKCVALSRQDKFASVGAIGEIAPFAWWLPIDRPACEFAAIDTLLAHVQGDKPIRIWDTRVGEVTSVKPFPMWTEHGNKCVFASEYLLITSSPSIGPRMHCTAHVRMYDLRSPGTVYEMAIVDSPDASDALLKGVSAFCVLGDTSGTFELTTPIYVAGHAPIMRNGRIWQANSYRVCR